MRLCVQSEERHPDERLDDTRENTSQWAAERVCAASDRSCAPVARATRASRANMASGFRWDFRLGFGLRLTARQLPLYQLPVPVATATHWHWRWRWRCASSNPAGQLNDVQSQLPCCTCVGGARCSAPFSVLHGPTGISYSVQKFR